MRLGGTAYTEHDPAMHGRAGSVPFDGVLSPEQRAVWDAEARRIELERQAARQAERPTPEPWDAWRTQKAPEMFEAEVTHRG